jgi:ribosomal protein S4
MRQSTFVQAALEKQNRDGRVSWIDYNGDEFKGKIISIPERDEIPEEISEQIIVELYSK